MAQTITKTVENNKQEPTWPSLESFDPILYFIPVVSLGFTCIFDYSLSGVILGSAIQLLLLWNPERSFPHEKQIYYEILVGLCLGASFGIPPLNSLSPFGRRFLFGCLLAFFLTFYPVRKEQEWRKIRNRALWMEMVTKLDKGKIVYRRVEQLDTTMVLYKPAVVTAIERDLSKQEGVIWTGNFLTASDSSTEREKDTKSLPLAYSFYNWDWWFANSSTPPFLPVSSIEEWDRSPFREMLQERIFRRIVLSDK